MSILKLACRSKPVVEQQPQQYLDIKGLPCKAAVGGGYVTHIFEVQENVACDDLSLTIGLFREFGTRRIASAL